MTSNLNPQPDKKRIPATVLLAVAIGVVVGSFILFQRVTPKPTNPETTSTEPESSSLGSTVSTASTQAHESQEIHDPLQPQPEAKLEAKLEASPQAPSAAKCWEGKFSLNAAGLKPAQKENLGERAQKLNLAALFDKLSVQKLDQSQLCVRAGRHVLPFERDTKDPAIILVSGGTGRINTKTALQVSYCLKSEDCAPCKIKKDSFEDALLGESQADSQANEDEDITAKLSPEVRRELARLESQSQPAAIEAWELQSASTRCGKG